MSDFGRTFVRPVTVFLVGLALRLALIAINPIVFGGDTILRLGDRFTLLKAHQLPLLQTLIAALSYLSMDPVLIRVLMALIGGAACAGFYLVARDLLGERIAFAAGLLFATNPYLTAVSTVPFQEILMLATLFFAFHFLYTERWWSASLWLAAACFTRHEAWAACPVFVGVFLWRSKRGLAACAKAVALFAWAPALWIAVYRGLAPGVHVVLEPSISIWRFARWAYVLWIAVKFTQVTVVALAAIGLWRIASRRAAVDWRWGAQAAFVALFLVALLFSAHGVMPDPERFVTSREACIPIYFGVLLAAAGLQQWPRLTGAVVAVSIALGAVGAWWYLHVETSEPDIQVSYRTARYLETHVLARDKVLVIPAGLDDSHLFLQKVRQLEGPEAEQRAQAELQKEQPVPFALQRLLVYSHLRPSQLVISSPGCTAWVVTWGDKPPGREWGSEPAAKISVGNVAASTFHRECSD